MKTDWKAGRGRVLLQPLGAPDAEYESPGGIVVPRAKAVRMTKKGGMEHAPLLVGRVLHLGEPDMHSRGGAPDLELGDLVIYHQDRPADVFMDGERFDVILAIDVLSWKREPKPEQELKVVFGRAAVGKGEVVRKAAKKKAKAKAKRSK